MGVTLAYVLASRGHNVQLVDRQPQAGAETSFANGGQLSYSHAEPWASPHVLPKLPKWLIDPNSPLIFRPRLDAEMMRWGLQFLRNAASAKRAEASCITMLRLGLYSRLKMQELMAQTAIAFDYDARGVLHVFETQKDWDAARRQAEFQAKYGCEEHLLSREEVMEIEPALQASARNIVGGLHAVQDAHGDANLFCTKLTELMKANHKVQCSFNTTIHKILAEGDRITGVVTDKGVLEADAYVMALGSYSPQMLRPLGIKLPIYPMKGYSITLPFNASSPTISITDGSAKIVYSKLGNRLRIAGTAEFAGYDTAVTESRIKPIEAAARGLFPDAAWDAGYSAWACLRPSTPAGPPLLGHTPIQNLYLNTGHGTLGWTHAAGSAYFVADMIERRPPEIITQGLTLGKA